MNKTQTLLLSAFIFLLIPLNSAFALYTDINETSPFYDEISELSEQGKLPEYTNNLFLSDEKLKAKDLYEILSAYTGKELSPKAGSNTNLLLSKREILEKTFNILEIDLNPLINKDAFPFLDLFYLSKTAPIAMKAAEFGIFEQDSPLHFKTAKRISKGEFVDYLYKIQNFSPKAEITKSNNKKPTLIENDKFAILLDIWESIHNEYLYKDEIDDNKLITGAIAGLVEELDDKYTSYQIPNKAQSFMQSLTDTQYEGIGATLETINNSVVIVSPFKGSPAKKAGLEPKDIIIGVDGEDVTQLSAEEIANKIKGPANTTVTIKIRREKNTEIEFKITRAAITYNSVQYEILKRNNKKIGYIEIVSFGDSTYNDFVNAAIQLKKEVNGLIIDLRNNPGGYLDTAVDLISLFTDEGVVATTIKFADGNQEIYKTGGKRVGLLKDKKVVILINEGSASASEILAGALQDFKVAKIIGTQSFGKGSVQQLSAFIDGSIFKFTTAKWFTPNDRDIDKEGITPDKEVKQSGNTDSQLNAALAEF